MKRPLLLVTMGDPAGIGPEISAAAALEAHLAALARILVVGDVPSMERALSAIGRGGRLYPVASPEEAAFEPGTVSVLPSGLPPEPIEPGRVQAAGGRAAEAAIETAVRLALTGRGDAVVTAPIHKEALRAAGVPHIGHTEMLAALTHVPKATTMFQVGRLRIFFLTRHVALADAISGLSRESVLAGIHDAYEGFSEIGLPHGRLAVAGLNPHAGDGGLFGDEEIRHIAPAVEAARGEGRDVTGPLPADSVFHRADAGEFDAVLALYHDQGHIAAKMKDFERTVSVTLGLPIIRTSVDHGTAFDIAGRGVASPVSLIEAARVAADFAVRQVGFRRP